MSESFLINLEACARRRWWSENRHRFDDEMVIIATGHPSPRVEAAWANERSAVMAELRQEVANIPEDSWLLYALKHGLIDPSAASGLADTYEQGCPNCRQQA